MASLERMTAVYKENLRFPITMDEDAPDHTWDGFHRRLNEAFPHQVVVRSTTIPRQPPREVVVWIAENIGPYSQVHLGEGSDQDEWAVGAWNWLFDDLGRDGRSIKYMFIDETDAMLFKIRWG